MGAGEQRLIKRRIKSVQSTKKITRAMELIAASRIIKAQQSLEAARPYAEQMRAVIANLAKAIRGEISHPLLERRDHPSRSVALVITSDRGLAGAFNANVLKLALQTLEKMPGDEKSVVVVGRKAEGFFRYEGVPVDRSWTGISDRPSYDDALDIAEYVIARFLDADFDDIVIVSTQFESMFRQAPVARDLLPIDQAALSGHIARGHKDHMPGAGEVIGALVDDDKPQGEYGTGQQRALPDTIFEPDPATLLGEILPKGVASQIFNALLESAASEHASRRRAMKAATDNANDLMTELQLKANKARQAAITTEIIEIVGGAQALENR